MCVNPQAKNSGSKDKQRIYFQDSIVKTVDKGTPFTDRISMNGTGATGAVVLTISNVQLRDEGEFICLIRSLTEGAGEGRTKLMVFGKMKSDYQETGTPDIRIPIQISSQEVSLL